MEKKNSHSNVQKITIAILITVILLMGGAYAWLTYMVSGTTENTVIIGNLELSLEDGKAIYIENALPVEDEVGLSYDPYHFTLKNDGTIDSEYTIYLDDDNDSIGEDEVKMKDQFIKYNLVTKGISSGVAILGDMENRKIYSGTLKINESQEFDLRLWMDINATNEAMDTVFAGKIRVEASQIKE